MAQKGDDTWLDGVFADVNETTPEGERAVKEHVWKFFCQILIIHKSVFLNKF